VKAALLISIAGEEILELDGEEVGAAGAATAALLVAVAVHLTEAAEVAAADPRDDVAAEVVPGGGVVAARLHGEVVQGALPVHDEPVLLRAAVPHRPEHLVERPVVRARHRHQPNQGNKKTTRISTCHVSNNGETKINKSIVLAGKRKQKKKKRRPCMPNRALISGPTAKCQPA